MENNRTHCPRCQSGLDDYGICHQCGYRVDDPYQGHPMKWYQFVVFVQLFVNIFTNAFQGVSLMTGSVFGEAAYHIHQVYPLMRIFNGIMGVALIGLCFMTVYTWRLLKYLKREAPFYLRAVRLLNIAIGLISSVGMLVIAELGVSYLLGDVTVIVNLIGVSLMIYFEKKYFERRSDIFIN